MYVRIFRKIGRIINGYLPVLYPASITTILGGCTGIVFTTLHEPYQVKNYQKRKGSHIFKTYSAATGFIGSAISSRQFV